MKRLLFSALLALMMTGPGLARKAPKPPTQPMFTEGCVTVSNIYYRVERRPYLEAMIHNNCGAVASVVVTLGYFDATRGQFGSGIESISIAPNTFWEFYHYANPESDWAKLNTILIIKVTTDPQGP